MPSFDIVDTHVHLWDPSRFDYAWFADIDLLNRRYGLEEFDAARGEVGVEAMVFVQCECRPDQALDEAAWIAEMAVADGRIQGMVAQAPLEQGTAVGAHLDELAQHGILRGVRRLLQSEADPDFCLQPDFVAGVQTLVPRGLSFDICIAHHQLAGVIELVRRCPDVAFVLDHIAKPDIKAGLVEPWATQLQELANVGNVSCKISGMVTEADHENWNAEQLRPYIDHVMGCFRIQRVMFGGDWPVSTLATTYPRWVATLDRMLDGWGEADLRALFRDNARRFYRLA